MSKRFFGGCAAMAIAILGCASAAQAGDYFTLTAVGQDGTTVTASKSGILPLIDNMINARGAYAPLVGMPFNASLTYGGVPNALLFSENPSQTSATLTIPATGFTRTFNGTSPQNVQDQIRDFIKTDGAGEYAAFIHAINDESPVAAVDGNPQAFTEFLASDAFNRFGLFPTLSEAPEDAGSIGEFRIDALGGESRAVGLDGYFGEMSIGSDIRFGDHVALSLDTAMQYRSVGGSATYFVGEEVGLPITIINAKPVGGFSWQVTPWGFGAIGASTDQVDGAVLVGGGGTSSLSYAISGFTFTLGDQISYAGGLGVKIDGDDFDTDVEQWILKNGGKVSFAPGKGPFFIDVGISYSNLLHHGAVPDYWTPELGMGVNFGRYSGIKLNYEGNFANNYSDNGARLTFFLAY